MVYAAYGVSGLTSIVGTFFVKDYLELSPAFLAALLFWAGIPCGTEYRHSIINGLPGFLIVVPDGKVAQTLSFEIQDGAIHRIYAVRNPDKLAGIPATLG